ncbi:MAG: thioredoxin domain-containing protein [Acidimicrobiia bacterium]|nr:thioredoxin domain-containing protein [Acidimicrobiia bacterium]
MPNRLANSTSPYLLQHQDNPVDWFEWGDEPFALAQATNRPVLLSVGYSACHWCHVMAHESFEDEATAQLMNEGFVNIKVDREERPDIDRIYMDALQTISGHGGWPMTVFLTPEAKPFYAGTYFPKEPRGNMPSFSQLLSSVRNAWESNRDAVDRQADQLTTAVARGLPTGDRSDINEAIESALGTLQASFDTRHGGFGSAPKFPQAPVLEMLLRVVALDPVRGEEIEPVVRRTLDAMRAGGIYDQVGGGFARYSVDSQWLIPHFEKMLYDNALLARVYLWAGRLFAEPTYTATARETLDYLRDEMLDPLGAVHSAEDADSEGVEGKYYVWDYEEFRSLTGSDADLMCDLYGVTQAGNFEGRNNLHLARSPQRLAEDYGITQEQVIAAKTRADAALAEARRQRTRPGRDDKVIAAWNGLALRAFAEAAVVLDDQSYRNIALGIARFVTSEMIDDGGRLMRSWRGGRTSGPGFAVDYAAMAVGLLALYQTTGDTQWFTSAKQLVDGLNSLFSSPDGFHTTGADQPQLIARPHDFMDNPLPSANSLAAEALITMGALTGEGDAAVDGIRRGASRLLERAPQAVAHLLGVLLASESGIKEVALVGPGPDRRALEAVVWETWRPDCVVALGRSQGAVVPLLADRPLIGDNATAYVCRNFVCDLPVTTPGELRDLLDD